MVWIGAVVGLVAMGPSPLTADDGDLIPGSLSRAKQERLRAFLDRRKKNKGAFIPEGSKFRVWANIHRAIDLPKSNVRVEKEYLAEIKLQRVKDAEKGPERADVYWYRPNPKLGVPGVTVKQAVDLNSGEGGETEVLFGYPAPLTREEREEAIALAKEKVPGVAKLLAGQQRGVTLDVLFQTIAVPKNPNGKPGDRVVTLRVRKRGEKTVLVDVNVTQGTVRGP
jgi:hypothetical protein